MPKYIQHILRGHPYVSIWGTGNVSREFLFVEDLADALIFLMNIYQENSHINIGTGTDISIKDLALLITQIIGYQGALTFDTTRPDGTPRKLLNVDKLTALGWQARTRLEAGLTKTIEWYAAHQTHTVPSRTLQKNESIL